jgi:hypothetical protein
MRLTSMKAGTAGFVLGLVLSAGYILSCEADYVLVCGGEFLKFPLWATVLFFPGFITGGLVGEYFYEHVHWYAPFFFFEAVGCLTVAVTYGIIFGLVIAVFRRLWRRYTSH